MQVLIERRQGDVGQQRGQDAALRRAGVGVPVLAELGEHPGLEERLDQREHPLVLDPLPHPVHQGRVVDRCRTITRLTTRLEDLPTTVRITRPRHPLQGKSLPVLGGMRRHGEPELLLVLPDGSKSLIRADWTDAAQPGADDVVGVATLGSLTDLLRACKLVADLLGREPEDRDRLQGCHRARRTPVQPVQLQFDTRPAPGGDTGPIVGTADADGRATARRRGHDRDHVAGHRDREGDRGRADGNRGRR